MATCYIIRGVPGTGKTTLAEKLVDPEYVCEANNYFTDEHGNYKFDPKKVTESHEYCKATFRVLIRTGADIAVSNTATRHWEYEYYVALAKKHGYDVQVIDLYENFGNIHNVPEEKIVKMEDRFEPHKYFRDKA